VRTGRTLLAALLLGLLSAGCGGGPPLFKPRGRLVRDGEPYRPGGKETVHLAFFRADGQPDEREACPALFNREDGTFQVVGKARRGIPAGKYRVAVQVMKSRKDLLRGAFAVSRTPLACEVPSSTGEITLDLKTPAGAPALHQGAGRR
jgi:hypothetical protein